MMPPFFPEHARPAPPETRTLPDRKTSSPCGRALIHAHGTDPQGTADQLEKMEPKP